jgi:endonuclease/exonuclease/phosphatase (EEP) superfamily protein YafD
MLDLDMGSVRFVLSGVVLSLGALSAVAAILAHGGRFSGHLDVLTHFAPLYLTAAVVVLVCAAFAPMAGGKLAMALLGGVAAAASLALMGPELMRRIQAPAPVEAAGQIKVIQFNVSRRDARIEQRARWMAQQDPDFLILEESTPAMRAAVLRHLPRHMSCGRTCHTVIFTRTAPQKVERPRRGRYGRGPAIAIVHMAPEDGGYIVVGTHYTWPTAVRTHRENTARMLQLIGPLPKPRLILVGDFNSTPWSFARAREEAHSGLERRTLALASWPTTVGVPFLPIDQVYAGDGLRTVRVERGPNLGSDHYPIVAILAPVP